MKKIITLLLFAGIFTATYAQSNYQKNAHYDDQYTVANHQRFDQYDNDSRFGNYHSLKDQKEMEAQRINDRYKNQIMFVQNNRYMTRAQKKRAIRDIKNERDRNLKMLNEKYKSYRR